MQQFMLGCILLPVARYHTNRQHVINLHRVTPSDRKRAGGIKDIYDPTRNHRLFDYKKNRAWAENLTIVMQLGLTMAGCIVFCFFVGNRLDKWLGLRGVFTTIFILLGIAGGANVCYRQIIEVTQPKGKVDSDGNGRNNV
jgi:F0F1-type ATP synthase assembly protein I